MGGIPERGEFQLGWQHLPGEEERCVPTVALPLPNLTILPLFDANELAADFREIHLRKGVFQLGWQERRVEE
jgi:hypothetical protein